jgi:hypothetical protein
MMGFHYPVAQTSHLQIDLVEALNIRARKKKSSKRGDLNLRMLPRARVLIHVLKTASVIARGVTEISPCVDYPEAGLAEENILGCVS